MAAKADQDSEAKVQEILDRTGYSHEVTSGQRKYGGPPPDWEGSPPGPGHEVYCGKLPKDVYEDELVPLFEKCGTIWDLRIMMDPATGQGRGFCFVTFTEKSAAELAVKEVDGLAIRPGKRLKANVSIPNNRLFVGNIPKNKSKEEIHKEFSNVTDGLNEVIVYSFPDEPKKKNRGFAFLDYDSHKSAASAKKRLGSGRFRVFNCDIIVDWADPQKQPDEETMSKIKVLYVRNLKADVTEDLLRSTFEVYGAVEKVKKIKDYGFVHFVEREGAIKALEALNETKINDSVMNVSLAKPPSDMKVKEERKMQHLLAIGARNANDSYWGQQSAPAGPRIPIGRGRSIRAPVISSWAGGAGGYRGGRSIVPAAAAYAEADYYGSGYDVYEAYGDEYEYDYDYDYDYYGYGASAYDDYGYDDYEYDYYYAPVQYAPRPRARGITGAMASMGRVRGGMAVRSPRVISGIAAAASARILRGAHMGLVQRRGRPFGRGAEGASALRGASRGIKRKAATDYNLAETKKPHTLQGQMAAGDGWGSQPIAQQPLSQAYADSEWYQDSYADQWG